MNEYEVTLQEDDGRQRLLMVEAETAARARDQAEDEAGVEVIQVRFVRALAFSCRIRGTS